MKKLLTTAATLAVLMTAANADPPPNVFLGRWCLMNNGAPEGTPGEYAQRKTCLADGMEYIDIRRNGSKEHYVRDVENDAQGGEIECKFVSVTTKPKEKGWVSIVRTNERCTSMNPWFDSNPWTRQVIYKYHKTGLKVRIEAEQHEGW